MSTLETILVAALAVLAVLLAIGLLAWWLLGRRGRALARRVAALPARQKAAFAGSLFGDPRLPPYTRVGLALLVAYLALPIDLIPDFIPVLGQVDDILMLAVGGLLLVRSVPRAVIEEHLSRLEAEVRDAHIDAGA